MNSGKLPPPFVVGENYRDREGEYTVIASDEGHITIERPDGRRMIADAETKARIHRNVLGDRDASLGSDRAHCSKNRREPTRRERGLIEKILQLEADCADHSGVEIDRLLAGAVEELGYSEEDLSRLNPKTGRSAFGNEGDWAKAKMTEEGWHEVMGSTAHWQGGTLRNCKVYRITPRGLEQLRSRS